jgi:hypothetical protein
LCKIRKLSNKKFILKMSYYFWHNETMMNVADVEYTRKPKKLLKKEDPNHWKNNTKAAETVAV